MLELMRTNLHFQEFSKLVVGSLKPTTTSVFVLKKLAPYKYGIFFPRWRVDLSAHHCSNYANISLHKHIQLSGMI